MIHPKDWQKPLAILVYFFLSLPSFANGKSDLNVKYVGAQAFAFELGGVELAQDRFLENQGRTLRYLKEIDVDRLLYVFRMTHGLSTQQATPNGGWDAPDFPFRSHVQGHFLSAWAQCYAVLRDQTCYDRAVYFAAELAKCQANNKAAGFTDGYVSGFPESDFAKLENGTLANGNVPYYAVHKTLAGLLDIWRLTKDTTARDVLLSLAGWVDKRTESFSYDAMQKLLQTEFGGMNDVMADLYHQTGNKRWLTVAQRFDHAVIFDPLAANKDEFDGLHANTQVPKWIGAARQYKATGNSRYLDIARNAWDINVKSHTYAIGGNSQAEHFHTPNAIAAYLDNDTCEACNSYNMLKLTRELWLLDPETSKYFDFYENSLLNHLLGQQNPDDHNGHITYFTPLNAGGRRGVGPAWGGGTWSTDYDSFWCCQGTALETNTKLMDSIYFYNESTLFINLFMSSVLKWREMGITLKQSTTYPIGDTSKLEVFGGGDWMMNIRIPAWASSAELTLNGEALPNVKATPGTYAQISRKWTDGDVVEVRFPMSLRTVAANDNSSMVAIAYGPTVLCGNYGNQRLSSTPTLALDSIKRSGDFSLDFTSIANGKSVTLSAFYDAQGYNYNVYWATTGSLRTASG
ncbi:Six-hairpin glycosidase [Penicillium concentricum]|uniref:Six-hairpin glycosidase n=1 Tax=Penicillium concentricum TaxID=293559 RepID=A0A9W9VHV8_9EURO|nr:Six-hairpin glycosidase [Penicillium concentricum]KAJ5382838.1 Six-hairpin glycosidase [Penicillium concentricum]